MPRIPTLFLTVGGRQEWHRWLQHKSRKEPGVWLVFYRKASGQSGLEYEEALDEAICYGWVDSLVQRLDDDRYAHLFSPRKDQKWSARQLECLERMIEAGRLTRDGLAVVDRPRTPVPGKRPR